MKLFSSVLIFAVMAGLTFSQAQTNVPSAVPPPTPAPVPETKTTDAEAIAALNLDAPGMEKVKAAVQSGNLPAIQQAYLDYRRTGNPAKWKVMPSSEPPAPATIGTDPLAEKICDNFVPGLGNFYPQGLNMGKDFNWQANPNPRTSPDFNEEWTFGPVGRMPYWHQLADAYWTTRNEKYAAYWVTQLHDFATKNPISEDGKPGHSPLWRTLDSAIRQLDSWPYAYAHFLNSPSFTPEANWLYYKLVLDHTNLLVTSLNHNPDETGNWVPTQCFGIYTAGALFPEVKDAGKWRDFAMDRLSKELARMVPPDGMEIELTPWYHRGSLDSFKGPLLLARLNGYPVPWVFKDKIMSMYRAMVIEMDQSGNDVPTNDGSGIVNAADTAKMGLKLGKDPLLDWAVSGGKTGKGLPDSTALPYAGFYMMRSGWKPDDFFLFFRAGPPGTGHEHQDMLEVTLHAWQKNLLVDFGGYTYDHSDWRRLAINTPAFSTIIVDGKWQHRDANKAPVDQPTNNPWITTPLFDYAAGTYDKGYQQNVYNANHGYHPEDWVGEVDHSVTHTRRVIYLRPFYALLVDTLDGTGHHTFDSHFQLDAPAAHVDKTSQAAFSDNQGDVQVGLYPLDKANLTVDIVQGQKDPLLGWNPKEHRAIPTVRFRKVQDAPAIFATMLYPYKGATAPGLSGTPLTVTGDGIWSQSLITPQEKTEIAVAKDGTSKSFSFHSTLIGDVHATAAGLLIRQPTGKTGAFWGGWGITSFSNGTTQFTVDPPASLVATTQGDSLLLYNGGDKAVNLTMTGAKTSTAALASGAWTEITATDSHSTTAPTLFPDAF